MPKTRACEACGREKDDGRALCSTCRVRKYRADPEKRERDRERSRRWKQHQRELGVPSEAGGNVARARENEAPRCANSRGRGTEGDVTSPMHRNRTDATRRTSSDRSAA